MKASGKGKGELEQRKGKRKNAERKRGEKNRA